MTDNPFPLNIDEKEDSWSRVQLLSSTGAAFKLPAQEFNKMVKAIEYNYENNGGLPFTGTPPVRTFQTRAQLLAFTPIPDDGTPAKVANDPNSDYNGFYSVVAGAWVFDEPLNNGEVAEGDIRSVSGDKVFQYTNNRIESEVSARFFTNSSEGNSFVKEVEISGSGVNSNKIYYIGLVTRQNGSNGTRVAVYEADPDFSNASIVVYFLNMDDTDLIHEHSQNDISVKLVLDWRVFEVNSNQSGMNYVFNTNAFVDQNKKTPLIYAAGLNQNTLSQIESLTSDYSKLVYEHPRGLSELLGDKFGFNLSRGAMFYEQVQTSSKFNVVDVNLTFTEATEVEIYIYILNSNTRHIGGLTPVYSGDLKPYEINTDPTKITRIKLDESITVDSGQYVQIAFYCKAGTYPFLSVQYFENQESNPARHGYYLTNTTSNWFGVSWSENSSFVTSFRLFLSEESKLEKGVWDRIILPSVINIAVGQELNLWKSNIVHRVNDVSFYCSEGNDKKRGYRYLPTSASDESLDVYLMYKGLRLDNKRVLIKSLSRSVGAGQTKQILMIGDSILDGGVIPSEVSNLISTGGGFDAVFLGTQTTDSVKHEGRPGWSYGSFLSNSSPFWDGSDINFKNYMSTNSNFGGSDIIDIVTINLGTNDILGVNHPRELYNEVLVNVKSIVDFILDPVSGYPSCKIVISLPPLPADKNGFGSIQGADDMYEKFETYIRLFWLELIKVFDDSNYNSNVSLGVSGLMLDRDYGFAYSNVQISARNTNLISEQNNNVHPNDSGEYQLADGIYSSILSVI